MYIYIYIRVCVRREREREQKNFRARVRTMCLNVCLHVCTCVTTASRMHASLLWCSAGTTNHTKDTAHMEHTQKNALPICVCVFVRACVSAQRVSKRSGSENTETHLRTVSTTRLACGATANKKTMAAGPIEVSRQPANNAMPIYLVAVKS